VTALISLQYKEIDMSSGKMDQVKGRVKEAAGSLIDDKGLKREGKRDQTVGKIKETTEKVIDKVTKPLTKKSTSKGRS
jgi:uncharacterized protein YjbJ (UPF0337 family)